MQLFVPCLGGAALNEQMSRLQSAKCIFQADGDSTQEMCDDRCMAIELASRFVHWRANSCHRSWLFVVNILWLLNCFVRLMGTWLSERCRTIQRSAGRWFARANNPWNDPIIKRRTVTRTNARSNDRLSDWSSHRLTQRPNHGRFAAQYYAMA